MRAYPTGEELGELMRQFREHNGVTQAEMADRAKIGLETWQRAEHGNGGSHLKTRARIYKAIGFSLSLPAEDADNHIPPPPRPTTRKGVHPMANRHDLSTGLIKCTITTEGPLPAPAYAVLAGLVEVLQRTDAEIKKLMEDADE